MTAETKPRRKKWKIAVGILLAVLILLAGGFFWYVSDYYRAEDVALEVLASGDHLEVRDDLTILSPSYPTDTAIIFYPGAKVEASAYLPLLNQLRQTGLTCILVEDALPLSYLRRERSGRRNGPVPGYPALVHCRSLHGRGHGLPVRFGAPGRGGRPDFAGSLPLRRLSAC